MFGVMRLTFDDEDESMSGDEDLFSVARTIPLVASQLLAIAEKLDEFIHTLDTQGCDTLVDGVQSIFNLYQLAAGGEGGE